MDKEYVAADISEASLEKITKIEKELAAENKEEIVLVAYTAKEPKQ